MRVDAWSNCLARPLPVPDLTAQHVVGGEVWVLERAARQRARRLGVRSPFCPDLVSFLPKRFVAYFSVLRIICSHFAVLHRYLLSSYSSFWRILASFLCLVCPYSATNIPSIFCQRILLYSDVFTECIFRLIRIREYCCAGHISLPDVFPPE